MLLALSTAACATGHSRAEYLAEIAHRQVSREIHARDLRNLTSLLTDRMEYQRLRKAAEAFGVDPDVVETRYFADVHARTATDSLDHALHTFFGPGR